MVAMRLAGPAGEGSLSLALFVDPVVFAICDAHSAMRQSCKMTPKQACLAFDCLFRSCLLNKSELNK